MKDYLGNTVKAGDIIVYPATGYYKSKGFQWALVVEIKKIPRVIPAGYTHPIWIRPNAVIVVSPYSYTEEMIDFLKRG